MRVLDINISDILIDDINVRKTQITDITELSSSIEDNGLINPITVREKSKDKYEIIAGHRRYLAMKELNKTSIPCNIVKMDDKMAMELSLIENLQKNNLSNCDKILSISKIYEKETDYNKIKSLTKLSKSQIKKFIVIKDLPLEILKKMDGVGKEKININLAIALTLLPKKIDKLEVISKITSLKSKEKLEVIKKFNENNMDNIEDIDDIIAEIENNNIVNYKGPYVFDSVEQKNLLIPENIYNEIVKLIKEREETEELIYF